MKISIENTKVILEIETISLVEKSDTYYFALDSNFKPDDESENKVFGNVVNLINNWKIQIEQNENISFLPFDFSDDYIGCLRIEKINKKEIVITYGFTTKYCGYQINPSNYHSIFIVADSDFRPTSDSSIVKKEILIKDLIESIIDFQNRK